MRPHGKAQVSALNPRAFACCDRCGDLVNHDTLRPAMRMAGPGPRATGFLVCPRCEDIPAEFERAIVLPPDPVPIQNPRRVTYGRDA